VIVFCNPNNPTGACATRAQLESLVAFAIENKQVIIYDSAYSPFIQDPDKPKTIFEIEGARQWCANPSHPVPSHPIPSIPSIHPSRPFIHPSIPFIHAATPSFGWPETSRPLHSPPDAAPASANPQCD
jgi:hypothetical protein